MRSKPNAEMPRFAAEQGFIRETAKRGDWRTNLKFASQKVRGLGYSGIKLRPGEPGKVTGEKEKVR